MAKLSDKIALITGSSSGIGRAVALAFAREGAHVAINYPDAAQEQKAAEVKKAIGELGRRVIMPLFPQHLVGMRFLLYFLWWFPLTKKPWL